MPLYLTKNLFQSAERDVNIAKASKEFQIFVKPIGSICNLGCHYCYYLSKKSLYSENESFRMSDEILEKYIVQHINASQGPTISFSWHGGEPTLLGLNFFSKVVEIQRKHKPSNRRIINGIVTNGTLIDKDWCNFFVKEGFAVGISIDGSQEMHNLYRVTKNQEPTFDQVMHGYNMLKQYNINCDVLCVVNSYNAKYPNKIYQFFKQIGARYITFLPLVEPQPDTKDGVSQNTVPSSVWGNFLCAIFDEWIEEDIGSVRIQIFEESARIALGQEHALCIFKEICGNVPVVEHNGDFFSCDHFVDPQHYLGNITEKPLIELLESENQKAFGQAKLDTLPKYCLSCEVRYLCNGECPKNRFIKAPDGENGLNYLCEGYKQFFNHCKPFISAIADFQQKQHSKTYYPIEHKKTNQASGRNDPCPCGSGLKFKRCCGK